MKFKKLAMGLIVVTAMNSATPAIKVFANELENMNLQIEKSTQENKSDMKKFEIEKHDNFEKYKGEFKISNELIESVSANGGQYSSSSPNKAIDENPSTHWETGKPNSSTFTNEFNINFKELVNIDKITYKVRQENGTKGFLKQYEIYGSNTDSGDDFTLVTNGSGTQTRDTVEINFDETQVKRIKIKFIEADGNWASMSELGFYKNDSLMDIMDNLFTDENKNQVNEEYRDINKLNELDDMVKNHPFYEDYKESIIDAKIILENEKINSTAAETSRFTNYTVNGYDELFKMDKSNIESIDNNAGHYASQNIERAVDGNLNTYWETNRLNSSTWNNEVEVKFKERVTLERIVYGARQTDYKGFAEEFEIYGSNTSEGDTYQLVATGKHNKVSGLVEAKFEPTEFKRIKFKFKKSNQNSATVNEFWFYKEDIVSEKMSRLFTDENKTAVSEEFNTIEKLETLELEAKEHPLYNDFKEDINDAKILINSNDIVASIADTKLFNHLENERYHEEYRVDRSNIKGITNNAGHYASQVIGRAIDGDVNTYWETNRSNTDTWKNEVTIELNEREVIDKIVYGARDDSKGSAHNMEILVSNTSSGNNFEVLTVSKFNHTNKLVEANFEPTQVKRVKLRYVGSRENWATATEIWLYKEDKLSDEVESVFANKLNTILNEKYDTLEELNGLEQEIANHPLKDSLQKTIDEAKELIEGTGNYVETIMTLSQDGNMTDHAKKTLKMVRAGQDYLSTGVYAQPGDVIEVFVDTDSEKLPSLVISQNNADLNKWNNTVSLKPGKNIITIPEINTEDYAVNVKPGGALYFVNPYTPEEQGEAPKVRIKGGDKFPVYRQGDDVEAFRKTLTEYKEKLDADNEAGTEDVLDIMEFESERMLMSVTATGAYNVYVGEGQDPLETALFWNDCVEEIFKFQGLDGRSPENDPKALKEHIRLMQPYGMMYAASNHVGVQGEMMEALHRPNNPGWGVVHEIGHRTEITQREYTEVTNNMTSMYMSAYYNNGVPENRTNYNLIAAEAVKDQPSSFDSRGLGDKLGTFWQLEMYSPGYWAKVDSIFRENTITIDKKDALIAVSCEALGEDVTEHFERLGFKASDEVDKEMEARYAKSTKKTWYLDNSSYLYDGIGINNDAKPQITNIKSNGDIEISSDIPKEDLLGYEIIKDGKIIGFTRTNKFNDTNYDSTKESKYSVVAYGHNLDVSKESDEVSSFIPSLEFFEDSIYVGLGDEFNHLKYVKALDKDGNDITDTVEISKNLDTSKKGTYDVEYKVTSNGATVTKILKVTVVSDVNYLSDMKWANMETQYSTPRLNENIKAKVDGQIRDFEKGIGIHANGKLEYDLGENHTYETFEAYIGVDANIQEQNKTSLTFKVIGDGEVLATTKTLNRKDDAKFIKIPLEGIRNLTIEIYDGGNGNELDWGIIADAKLTTNNIKPTLDVDTNNLVIEQGTMTKEEIIGSFNATDVEDGDLTDKVVITGAEQLNPNRFGEHEITYTVTDLDGNTVTKTKEVVIVSELNYASDIDWKSATSGWLSVTKDKAINTEKKIKLGIDGNHKEFDKGLSTASHSEIVYDLEGKDYTRFMSYVGAELSNGTQYTTVVAKAYLDGEEVFNSGALNINTPAQLVDLDLTGAKELKLVIADGGNGTYDDVASWGDAKFITNNAKPTLEVDDSKLVVEQGTMTKEEIIGSFTATDIEDGDLTDKVVITGTEQLNPNRFGQHEITYSVTDSDNNTVTKTKQVSVVSGAIYASDVEWESATSGWREVNKDKAVASENKIKLKIDGTIKEFDKGIGAATNSEIVYNVEGKGYTNFTAYLGTDKNYNHNSTSIDFEIYTDDKLVYESNTIRKDSNAEFVNIDLTDVKELKLVADNHDGNGVGDFVSYGDAKFMAMNMKPTLEIDKSISTKVGEPIEDVIGNIKSLDTEDGDLTSNVKVSGHENIEYNKPGEYEITYSVTDIDGNTTTKTRTISVVDMRDYKYLTEYDWKSATQSYGNTGKDVSVNGNKIRLTGENDQEIVYDRGIGAHANGTVIYDLTDKNYEYFTSYVGVDRNMYGSVASVEFEVYVDGEKKYDSGLMTSRDSQKFIEVDINGAKELKLVITDGGNGIGSDHGSFGDAKLHFVNSERADMSVLEDKIVEVEKLDLSEYTEESVKNLQSAIDNAKALLENEGVVTEVQVTNSVKELEDAVSKLALKDIEVKIPDILLEQAIRDELGLYSFDTLKASHMKQLVKLDLSYSIVEDLTGLEYAQNLESLNITNAKVRNLSPLKDLSKLTDIKGKGNYVITGNKCVFDGEKFIVETNVKDIDGTFLIPSEIVLTGGMNVQINSEDVFVDGKVIIPKSLLEGNDYVSLKYKSSKVDFEFETGMFLAG